MLKINMILIEVNGRERVKESTGIDNYRFCAQPYQKLTTNDKINDRCIQQVKGDTRSPPP